MKVSRLFRDRPMSPLDTAIYWSEYVIRHKGGLHIQSASLELSWYEDFLIDVGVIFSISLISVLTLVFYFWSKSSRKRFDSYWSAQIYKEKHCFRPPLRVFVVLYGGITRIRLETLAIHWWHCILRFHRSFSYYRKIKWAKIPQISLGRCLKIIIL